MSELTSTVTPSTHTIFTSGDVVGPSRMYCWLCPPLEHLSLWGEAPQSRGVHGQAYKRRKRRRDDEGQHWDSLFLTALWSPSSAPIVVGGWGREERGGWAPQIRCLKGGDEYWGQTKKRRAWRGRDSLPAPLDFPPAPRSWWVSGEEVDKCWRALGQPGRKKACSCF